MLIVDDVVMIGVIFDEVVCVLEEVGFCVVGVVVFVVMLCWGGFG